VRQWTLGVDIGGTKLAAGRVDDSGVITRRRERPTPTGDGATVWDALVAVVDDVLAGEGIAQIGVGCGGPMDRAGGCVSPLNIPGWREFPLRDQLQDRYGARVALHNDAIAMALGEQQFGAGRGSDAFLGMVVSTGVGGGLVIGGRPVDGRTGNAGHIGHVVVDPAGPRCTCGGRGCLEAIARGPAVIAWAREQGWAGDGDRAQGPALVATARAGDPIALAALTRAGQAVGVALASAVALTDVDVVAIGGGLANAAGDLLIGPARTAFAAHGQLDFVRGCAIRAAALGADAGIVGAAALVGIDGAGAAD
jgi:glucokinase